jgi:flagellar biosynthetic protein FliP
VLLPLSCWPCLMAAAQGAPASLPLLVGQGRGGTSYSVPIQTLLFFTALSFLPAILLMMTGFTRIVIVLSLLRQALGTQSAPPNQVVIGLSLFLTMFVMGPTLDKVYQDAYLPYTQNSISFEQAMERPKPPCAASCSSRRASRTLRCSSAWPSWMRMSRQKLHLCVCWCRPL